MKCFTRIATGLLSATAVSSVAAHEGHAAVGSILHAMEHLVWWVGVLAVVWLAGAALARYSRDRQ